MAVAREGAKVGINDPGCETDSTGASLVPADQVAKEINKAGGTAVANYDSVTTSQGTRIGKILGEQSDENSEVYGSPDDVAPLVAYLVSEQANNISNCVFEVHANYIALYEDPPPHKVQTLNMKEGRFTPSELQQLLPQTLTQDVRLPVPLVLPKLEFMKSIFAPNAKGWLLENGKLIEVLLN